MTVQIVCPSCGATYRYPEDRLGRKVQCAKCKQLFISETAPEGMSGADHKGPACQGTPPSSPSMKVGGESVSRTDNADDRRGPRVIAIGNVVVPIPAIVLSAIFLVIVAGASVVWYVASRPGTELAAAQTPVSMKASVPATLPTPTQTPAPIPLVNPLSPPTSPQPELKTPKAPVAVAPEPVAESDKNHDPPAAKTPNRPEPTEPPKPVPPAKEAAKVHMAVAKAPPAGSKPPEAAPPAPETVKGATSVQVGKAATALVEIKGRSYGSAFCVHASGFFVTNEHVVRVAGLSDAVTLVLDAGLKTQRVLKAKVVRTDAELDLALLRTEGVGNLPVLELGSDANLTELMELVAFGYPFGTALAASKGEYPAISVNAGRVTSLRRKDGQLFRIQLDAALNPGNSGGPVLDRGGKIIGVVEGGVPGAGLNLAIPVSQVRAFVSKPDIVFTPPEIARAQLNRAADFRARAVSLLPTAMPLKLVLVLSAGKGDERRHDMDLANGVYQVRAIPVPGAQGPITVQLEAKYADGLLAGTAADASFSVGGKPIKLSDVRSIRLGAIPRVVRSDGTTMAGAVTGLGVVPIKLGGQSLRVDLGSAAEITIEAGDNPVVTCTIVALDDGKEVGRVSETMGAVVKLGFIRPRRSLTPATYLRAVSSKGDYIGQGQTYLYKENLIVRPNGPGLSVSVGGWNAVFTAPRSKSLQVGEYNSAKRWPFNEDSPGISFTGNGRGCNHIAGKFVVWELEQRGDQVVRLAIDFLQHCEETMPPLKGSIRINSSFE